MQKRGRVSAGQGGGGEDKSARRADAARSAAPSEGGQCQPDGNSGGEWAGAPGGGGDDRKRERGEDWQDIMAQSKGIHY